ncbi:MAG: TerD family protein [Cyanobacteriota bacterium]
MGINLTKGQAINLEKEAGSKLTKVMMGLGWDPVKAQKSGGFLGGLFGGGASEASVDLDASCIMFNEQNEMTDAVWFRQLKSKDGSITHTGDNLTGAGDGDDEQIIVELSRIPANVKTLVFTVNSFTGQSFDKVANSFCRLMDHNGKEVAKFELNCQGAHTALIMAKMYLHNGEWKMKAIGENANGRTFNDLMPIMKNYL